ncbi:MAG TPA: hypothetical protein VII99_10075 [Bacteroidia bacterium]
MIYRFRVTYEDHEDVFRDIEIKAAQSFTDLHLSIQESIGFDNSKPAFFYLSDDYWRKEEEIIAINTAYDSKKSKLKKPAGAGKEATPKKKLIVDFVNDPHQRFIYFFDPDKEWTFQLELLKILPEENGVAYPRCVKISGTSPKQYKETNLPPPPVEEEDVKNGKEELLPEQEIKDEVAEEEDDIAAASLGEEDVISPVEDEEIKSDEEKNDPEEEGESSDEFNLKDDEDF